MRSRVEDVMTTEVIAVDPSTSFKELVNLLAAYRVSALPVVDAERRPVGIVSEGDLLLKEALPAGVGVGGAEEAKASGRVAADLMTTPVVSVGPLAGLAEAARLARAHGVKRLPVVDADGRLVGIVSRGDLLKVFLRGDAQIRTEIVRDVLCGTLAIDPSRLVVEVRDGIVTLGGTVEWRAAVPLVVRLAGAVDGVVCVEDRLGWEDDAAPGGPGP
jgi:CBS domain-containing protein